MSEVKDRELLRRLEMISRINPSPESTVRAMDRARQALLDAAQAPAAEPELASKTRYIRWRPLTQAAVAAMVLATISIGIVVWKQSLNRPSELGTVKHTNPFKIDESLANLERLKLEAGQIRKLAALADTQGLLDMLETAQPASQQIIAEYLGNLAGPEAVPSLSRITEHSSMPRNSATSLRLMVPYSRVLPTAR